MFKFETSPEAMQVALNALSENGRLNLVIEMIDKNHIQLSGKHGDLTIVTMEPIAIAPGMTIELEGTTIGFQIS